MVTAGKRPPVIDGEWQIHVTARSCRELQSRERVAAAGDDCHHGPVTAAEHPRERLFINGTGLGRVARMRVNPDSAKLLGTQPAINLSIKELGN